MHPKFSDRFTMTAVAALLALVVLAGCKRDTHTANLVAPFDDDSVLAVVDATWSPSDEKRSFADGARLKETEIRFPYRIAIRNRHDDKLLVRLENLALTDKAGLELGRDAKQVECILAADGSGTLLSGEVWIPEHSAKAVHGFSVGRFAVPLDDKGRARSREWLLKGRPDATAEIDADLARYAASPPCTLR